MVERDQIFGVGLLLGSIAVIIAYFYLVFLSPWSDFVIQLTAFIAIFTFFAILAWVGYTMATTSTPKLEDAKKEIGKEKGKEGEVK